MSIKIWLWVWLIKMGVVNIWAGLAFSLLLRSRPLVVSFRRRNLSTMATPEGGVSQTNLDELSEGDKEQFSDEEHAREHVPSGSASFSFSSFLEIRAKVLKDLQERSFSGTPFGEHSKNAQRKLLRIHTNKYLKKQKRLQEKKSKDQLSSETESFSKEKDYLTRLDAKREIAKRLEEARLSGQKLAIDCSMEGLMSPKQLASAARQLKRLYGTNTRHTITKPFHIHLTGLLEEGKLRQALHEQFNGFDRVISDITSKRHEEYFPKDSIVYLTPDSPNTLDCLDTTKVYVIGGLVDSSAVGPVSYAAASECGINTARLPIDDTIIKKNPSGFVLTIDQVFGLLLEVGEGKSWTEAFDLYLPKRKRCYEKI